MSELTLHEEDLLQAFNSPGLEFTGAELQRYLGWGTTRTYEVLASLEEKGRIECIITTGYDRTRYYRLKGDRLLVGEPA